MIEGAGRGQSDDERDNKTAAPETVHDLAVLSMTGMKMAPKMRKKKTKKNQLTAQKEQHGARTCEKDMRFSVMNFRIMPR